MRTRVTELLGIKYPIILGGMHWLGRGRLAAAVSEAGGLGLVSAGTLGSRDELQAEIDLVRSLTTKPFGVNISLGYRDMGEFFEAVVHAKVDAVFTSGRNPEKYIPQLKDAGILWVHVAPTFRHALKAEKMGADAVVMVGIEAGGHPGPDDVTLMASIPKASSIIKIPVIAAGSITNGKSFLAALAMGAEGVQIGTRFIATEECIAHSNVKELIAWADETDAVLFNLKNGGRTRAVKKEAVERFKAGTSLTSATAKDDNANDFVKVFRDGDIEAGLVIVGQGLGTINEILTVHEVIENIMSEARESNRELDSFFEG
ncbi:MAG: nitronate monooxygenase [Firmicutes bacterium]|nr:nitronate monooxygenase [Bacillota bacterium]